jgi:hypothetical protein
VINGTNGVNINGAQTGAINYMTDGINTQDNLLNGAFNTLVSNTVSVDRVEEFRIVTSPADAEYGRGSGQVQMMTRGGTNRYTGSAWEELRNTDLLQRPGHPRIQRLLQRRLQSDAVPDLELRRAV